MPYRIDGHGIYYVATKKSGKRKHSLKRKTYKTKAAAHRAANKRHG